MPDFDPVFYVPTIIASVVTTLVLFHIPRAMNFVGRSLSRIGKKTA